MSRREREKLERKGTPLYSDSLVEIRSDSITFRGYYFPAGSKTLPLVDVDKVIYWEPRWWSGKYRYWGSGDFRTWCPKDFSRHTRDRMFLLLKRGRWTRIAFTVEDPERVIWVLRELGIPLAELRRAVDATP